MGLSVQLNVSPVQPAGKRYAVIIGFQTVGDTENCEVLEAGVVPTGFVDRPDASGLDRWVMAHTETPDGEPYDFNEGLACIRRSITPRALTLETLEKTLCANRLRDITTIYGQMRQRERFTLYHTVETLDCTNSCRPLYYPIDDTTVGYCDVFEFNGHHSTTIVLSNLQPAYGPAFNPPEALKHPNRVASESTVQPNDKPAGSLPGGHRVVRDAEHIRRALASAPGNLHPADASYFLHHPVARPGTDNVEYFQSVTFNQNNGAYEPTFGRVIDRADFKQRIGG